MNEAPSPTRKPTIRDRIAITAIETIGPDIDALNARISQLEDALLDIQQQLAKGSRIGWAAH